MRRNQVTVWGIVLSVLLGIIALRSNSTIGEETKMTGVFELRTYTTLEGRLPQGIRS